MKTNQCQFYVSDDSRNFFLKQTADLVEKSDLNVSIVENGVIAVNTKTGAYGVMDSDNRFVKSSQYFGQFIPQAKHLGIDIPYMDCDAIFCGNCIAHFGHFMLERMNRVWPVIGARFKNAKIVFVSKDGTPPADFVMSLLLGLGISADNIIILSHPVRFRRVLLPEPAFCIPDYTSVQMGDIYRQISNNYGKRTDILSDDVDYTKVYVSRGAMDVRRTFGERQIERIFAENGFTVIYPETLPLVQQIAIMARCHTLAGAAGTALHLALFMKPGGTVIQLKRNSPVRDCVANQNMVNKTIGLNFVYIAASVESVPTEHFTNCPQILGVTPHLRRFFDDNGFKYTESDIKFDDVEWNRYQVALGEYMATHNGWMKLKRKLIKLVACFIPGRVNRGRFRTWAQNHLGVTK